MGGVLSQGWGGAMVDDLTGFLHPHRLFTNYPNHRTTATGVNICIQMHHTANDLLHIAELC